ncbi:competence protein CoiA family protein [Metabacillus fastidiosus]|uniref:competence protein CoiA n=1 Tax=Metabacillus fastidiosus TaxID=1458 RepID=UPI003D2778C9
MLKKRWIPIFIAKMEGDRLLNVADQRWSKEKLREIRQYTSFKCPICFEEVDLKVGSQITPHFAHQRRNNCDIEVEPESEYHLNGKLQLYNWLQGNKIITDVQLEMYLQQIKQRPDLLFTYENNKIVLEYQCSTIGLHLFSKRTKQLKSLVNDVKWVIGAKEIKRLSKNTFRVSPFQWLFIHTANSPKIYSYCANMKAFIILHHIIPFSAQIVFSQSKTYYINNIQYNELVSDSVSYDEVIKEWFRKVHRFRMKPLGFMSKEISFLSEYLYEKKQLSLTMAPSYAFIPLKKAYLIKSSCYHWQTWILLYLDSIPLRMSFSLHEICYFMRNKVVRRETVIGQEHISLVIHEYLKVLAALSLLNNKGKFQFEKIKQINWTKNLYELIDIDRHLKNKLLLLYRT